MTKSEFIDALSEKLNIPKLKANDCYNAVFEVLCDAIKNGEEVTILNLGKFSVIEKSARTARNPSTGEPIEIPAHKVVKFKVSRTLKEAVINL